MTKREYSIIFGIGAKLLGTFGASVQQANARMRSLESTAQKVAASIKHIWSTIAVSLASFAIGNLFKKAFEGAFEAAADAQQRALSLTNEFFIHMQKQGYEAAEQQTKFLIEFNQGLAKTGVLGRGVFDAMADSLSKIGLAPKEIADMEPILGGLLVRAKGIRATASDAADLGETIYKAALGGRLLGLLRVLPITPSERTRLKAYKDDWRGAIQYIVFLASKYKDFNVALRNTPLGQIQRMRNSFAALARDIGETILPAQADMAAAWEQALPQIKPAILFVMTELARAISFVTKELSAFMERAKQPDAKKSIDDLNKSLHDLFGTIGIEVPAEGLFGRLFGFGAILEIKILTYKLQALNQELKGMGVIFNFLFGDIIKAFHRMSEELNNLGKILKLVKVWLTEAIYHPIDAAYHRLQDFLALLHIIKKPSKETEAALTGVPPAAQGLPTKMPPVPEWVKKDPRLLRAYQQGAAPATGRTISGPNYPAPPPPAGPAVLPPYGPTSQRPIMPAAPSIRIYGQPSTIGGGLAPSLPPGATMPYGPSAGVMPVPSGAGGGYGGGGGGGGGYGATGDSAAAAKAQADIAAAAKGMPGTLSPQQQKGAVLYGKLLAQFREHPPQGLPPDAARFGITKGTPEEWARWGVAVAHAESGFNPRSTNLTDPGGSFGVFQYSHGQAYGNAYDVDNSVRAFVRDANEAAKSAAIRSSILGKRFSTIGSHPDRGTAYLGQAERIAQATQAAPQASQPPPLLAAVPQMQAGGIVKSPTLALLGEKGPEAVLPQATPSPLPSPPVGASGSSMLYNAISPFLPYAQAAMHGRFFLPSWMVGGKGQWMQASMGAPTGPSAEMSPWAFGEGLKPHVMTGAMEAISNWMARRETSSYNMTHSPVINIHGAADDKSLGAMKIQLEDAAKQFIKNFKDAQRHERRLSYESGYSG